MLCYVMYVCMYVYICMYSFFQDSHDGMDDHEPYNLLAMALYFHGDEQVLFCGSKTTEKR